MNVLSFLAIYVTIDKKLLHEYNVVENRELHCVWDFKEWLEPHMHPIRGFATSQFGDGMHEFILRKDGQG
eukprot:12326-Pleurochrysis_carterae.AAC.1